MVAADNSGSQLNGHHLACDVTDGSSVSGTAATAGKRRNFWHRFVQQATEHRIWLLAAAHLLVFTFNYWLAWALRFDFTIPEDEVRNILLTLPIVLTIKLVLFELAGQLHGWWRYVTFADLTALFRVSLLSLCALALVDFFIPTLLVPRSVLLLDCLLSLVVLGGSKSSLRLFREQFWPKFRHADYRRALLVGHDESTAILAHQIHSHGRLKYRIVGLLLTDGPRDRRRFSDIPIIGAPEDVLASCARFHVQEILVTAGVLGGARLRQILDACTTAGLEAKIIRPVDDLVSGNQSVPVREIEINDLLRRDPVQLDMESIGELITGASVMITGAGGSIGSEICRQLVRFQPQVLVMVDRAENGLFFVERELRETTPCPRLVVSIADINDEPRMRQLFATHRPQLVFHAAAHKHVPMMEANVSEAIKNNVLGTNQLVNFAHEFRAQRFIFISTDKAVNPTSVMGATKQIAERYVHAMSQESDTAFIVVRFGNVLGSAGSVIPIFKEQIRRGGPITITDIRMTRFFMTIPEASQLVLQAAAMGKGHEIFVLDMGEPVKIVDLARDLIRLSGLPEHSIEITFTGLRPGEKLYEELYLDAEETLPTSHPKIRAACPRPWTVDEVQRAIDSLADSVARFATDDEMRSEIQSVVTEYKWNPPTGAKVVSGLAVTTREQRNIRVDGGKLS